MSRMSDEEEWPLDFVDESKEGAEKYGDPRVWSEKSISKMAKSLALLSQKHKYNCYKRRNIPYVRACDYKGEPVNLKSWVDKVKKGRIFGYNESLADFRSVPLPKRIRNARLWELVSEIYAIENEYWIKKSDLTSKVFPDVSQLVFRDKRDFFCGSWRQFMQYWLPYINCLLDEKTKRKTYETVHSGADLPTYSEPVKRKDARLHRFDRDGFPIYLYTKRVRSKEYVFRRQGSRFNRETLTKDSFQMS